MDRQTAEHTQSVKDQTQTPQNPINCATKKPNMPINPQSSYYWLITKVREKAYILNNPNRLFQTVTILTVRTPLCREERRARIL